MPVCQDPHKDGAENDALRLPFAAGQQNAPHHAGNHRLKLHAGAAARLAGVQPWDTRMIPTSAELKPPIRNTAFLISDTGMPDRCAASWLPPTA